MKHRFVKKIIISSGLLILAAVGFYKFVTYDRNYYWTKELPEIVERVIQNDYFLVSENKIIGVEKIKLSKFKRFRLFLQEGLNKINLMNYGSEFGQLVMLTDSAGKQQINVKAWCLGDHIIGIEMEYRNIPERDLSPIKEKFEKEFSNYKLIWTKL